MLLMPIDHIIMFLFLLLILFFVILFITICLHNIIMINYKIFNKNTLINFFFYYNVVYHNDHMKICENGVFLSILSAIISMLSWSSFLSWIRTRSLTTIMKPLLWITSLSMMTTVMLSFSLARTSHFLNNQSIIFYYKIYIN